MGDEKQQKATGPLQGLKVIDLTRMLPGPFGTMMLADLGADVTVIEQPSGPALGPRRVNFAVDRNKRSLAMNLKDERAKEILYKLVRDADVFVEGFRPGVTERLKIDYSQLREINPGLIYCSISGYGQDGPYRLRVGHDLNYMATAGTLHLNGRKDTGPVVPFSQLADIAGGGINAAFSILAALYYRNQTGMGQYIDISMTDGAMTLNPIAFLEYTEKGVSPEPQGYRNLGETPCYNIYRTKDDRHVTIGALEPKFWALLCKLLGREDLIERQNETDGAAIEEMKKIFSQKTMAEWDALLDSEEVCYAPVLNLEEARRNPQVMHRNMFQEIECPDGSISKQPGVAPRFSLTPGSIRRSPVRPGHDTYEILGELGMDAMMIENLEKEGVISGIPKK